MPRQSRFIVPQVAMHVIQRGNNKAATFLAESDYLVYLHCLGDLAAKLDCAVHAYCLMSNHVHLLVTPPSRDACISLMRNLGQRYVQYFNRRHARSGTLWEGRFKSCIAESARYVLACYRYIELNPIRAGMVRSPRDYRWSSHASNIGQRDDRVVSPHVEFLALGENELSRGIAYRSLFDGPLEASLLAEIRASTSAGYPLASDAFKCVVADTTTLKLAPGKSGRPSKNVAGGADEKQGDLLSETGL